MNLVDAFENVDMIRSIDPKSDLNAIKAIRKLLKKYKPDIVYCHSSKAGALGRIANMGLKNKCVYNPHGWAFNMRGNKLKKLIYVGIEKVLAPFCSTIICISGAEKRSALKYRICGKKKLKVIYNGIDFDEYNMDYHMNTRELLEIPEDAFVVGMVGRLAEQKAPDVFVKAAKRIKEKIPKAFFLIVGDGPDWDEVQQEVEDNKLTDSFILAGWTRRPMEYFKNLDIAVLISRWEGFGLNHYERMVSYLYSYKNREKLANVGYAKVEKRGMQCRIMVQMRAVVTQNAPCVYLYRQKEDGIRTIMIGNMYARGTNLLCKSETKRDDLFGTGKSRYLEVRRKIPAFVFLLLFVRFYSSQE